MTTPAENSANFIRKMADGKELFFALKSLGNHTVFIESKGYRVKPLPMNCILQIRDAYVGKKEETILKMTSEKHPEYQHIEMTVSKASQNLGGFDEFMLDIFNQMEAGLDGDPDFVESEGDTVGDPRYGSW